MTLHTRFMTSHMKEVLKRDCYIKQIDDYVCIIRVNKRRDDGYCEIEQIDLDVDALDDDSIEMKFIHDVRPEAFLHDFKPLPPIFFGSSLNKLRLLKKRLLEYEEQETDDTQVAD